FHDVHARAAAGQRGGHEVAGDGGAREQDAAAGEVVRSEGVDQAFGDVLGAHEIDLQVQRFNRRASGGTDGADLRAKRAQVGGGAVEAIEEEADAVGAGEDQPVVLGERGD